MAILLLISIAFALVECLYQIYDVPQVNIKIDAIAEDTKVIILGDSRVLIGVQTNIPEIGTKLNMVNLGSDGGAIIAQMKRVINEQGKTFIIGVSPASLFGLFSSNTNRPELNYLKISKYLNSKSETFNSMLNKFLLEHFRFMLGFDGLIELLKYGTISEYRTKGNSISKQPLGDDIKYYQLLNKLYYSNFLLKTSSTTIMTNKEDFADILYRMTLKNKVFVVRMPINDTLYQLENNSFPFFDKFIESVARKNGIKYFIGNNLIEYDNENSDWSHLNRNQSIEFTIKLLKLINNSEQNSR